MVCYAPAILVEAPIDAIVSLGFIVIFLGADLTI
jgi:hypothetical protein